jgi:hypothetical protein
MYRICIDMEFLGDSPTGLAWYDDYAWSPNYPNRNTSSGDLELDPLDSFRRLNVRSEPTTPEVRCVIRSCFFLNFDYVVLD